MRYEYLKEKETFESSEAKVPKLETGVNNNLLAADRKN